MKPRNERGRGAVVVILAVAVFAAVFAVMRLKDKPSVAAEPLDVMKGIDRTPVQRAAVDSPAEAAVEPASQQPSAIPEPVAVPWARPAGFGPITPVATEEPEAPNAAGPHAQSTPQGAAADMLQRLKKGDFLGFITNYMPPSQFAGMPDDAKEKLGERVIASSTPGTRDFERMQALIAGLESIQGAAPAMNEEGTRARFQLANRIDGTPDDITFQLENGKWYLR